MIRNLINSLIKKSIQIHFKPIKKKNPQYSQEKDKRQIYFSQKLTMIICKTLERKENKLIKHQNN